jgi:signal recognition particle receptor subunit beta
MRVFLISPSANVRRVYGLSSSRVKDGLELTEKMVFYNASTKELTAKIVYYGPGLGGKTTNLQLLHDRLDPHTVGKLVTLSTRTDRTIYFDLLPVELGEIKGYKIRFQLATVPGQTAFNETRKVVLRGADGIVFVADSRWAMLPKNLESWQNLKDNLKENGSSFETIPVVVQYNKRDLTDVLSVEAMQEALGLSSYPFVEAVASAGRGITETFKLVSKLTFVDLLRRLQGRKPEEAAGAPARPPLALVALPAEEARPGEADAVASAAASDTSVTAIDENARAVPAEPAMAPAAPPGEDRWAGLEKRLAEISEILARETEERTRLAQAAAESKQRLEDLENRLEGEEQARRAAEKATDAALASLSARAEKLYQEIAGVVRQVSSLEAALDEKTSQGLREAEDIRAQIAPLLEARDERAASEQRSLAELDRLRESLADSLAEIADRLRRAVR